MSFFETERGQSQVLGALFIFAFLVVGLAFYQASVVPAENRQTELNHFIVASDDFAQLETAFANAGTTGESRQATIQLGTRYASRSLAMNPPPVTGQLSSSVEGEYEFVGVQTDRGPNDHLASDVCGQGQQRTHTFEYEPEYNELRNTGQFVFENNIAYRTVDDAVIWTKNSTFIDGTTISLTPLNESVSSSGIGSETLRFVPAQTGQTTIEAADTTGAFGVQFPSKRSQAAWRSLLSDNPNVETVTKPGNADTVTVRLNDSKDYTVSCTAVGIGSAPPETPNLQPQDQTDNSPVATIDGVEDESSAGRGSQQDEVLYTIEWNVSDDVELSQATLTLQDSSGDTVDSVDLTVSGRDTQGSSEVSVEGGNVLDQRYVIKLTVEDSAQQVDTESVTDYADGDP